MFAKITNFVQARFAKNEERGASAVEYGLLIAGIAALIVVAVFALGPIVRDAFDKTCDTIASNDGNASTAANCTS
jgi:pilus assembly protein Flp/PilA